MFHWLLTLVEFSNWDSSLITSVIGSWDNVFNCCSAFSNAGSITSFFTWTDVPWSDMFIPCSGFSESSTTKYGFLLPMWPLLEVDGVSSLDGKSTFFSSKSLPSKMFSSSAKRFKVLLEHVEESSHLSFLDRLDVDFGSSSSGSESAMMISGFGRMKVCSDSVSVIRVEDAGFLVELKISSKIGILKTHCFFAETSSLLSFSDSSVSTELNLLKKFKKNKTKVKFIK